MARIAAFKPQACLASYFIISYFFPCRFPFSHLLLPLYRFSLLLRRDDAVFFDQRGELCAEDLNFLERGCRSIGCEALDNVVLVGNLASLHDSLARLPKKLIAFCRDAKAD